MSTDDSDDRGKDEGEKLERLRKAFERAENRGDPSVQIANRDPDAYVRMPPHAPPMDFEAAAERLRSVYAEQEIDVVWTSDGVIVDEQLAVDSGTFEISFGDRQHEEPTVRAGSWLMVYRRDENGCWRVIRDIYNWNE